MRTRRRGGDPPMVNELTPQELGDINKQQSIEVDGIFDKSKDKVIREQMEKLRKLDGKVRKAILTGIAGYNVAQRRLDNVNPYLAREKKSEYPCGSVTCKQRGKKIKNALIYLSNFDEHALGEIGVLGQLESIGNYFIGNKNREERPPPLPRQGGSRRKR